MNASPYSIPVKPDPEGDRIFQEATDRSVQRSEAICSLYIILMLIGAGTVLYWAGKLALWFIKLAS